MNYKITKIIKRKSKQPIVCLTAYSKSIATILDKYCDIILVGDSLANVLYGMKSTNKVSLEMMANHAKSVMQGVKKSLCVVDMPKGTYDTPESAIKNARYLLKVSKCDAIKIESNNKNFKIIKKLIESNISVMGHIGFTPQYKKKFKVQGLNHKQENQLINESIQIEKEGAFSIVLEGIKTNVAKKITSIIKIPTIGIGSSIFCDGQIIVTDDMIGLSGFYPKFVKKYANISKVIEKAVKKYDTEVRKKIFPTKKNSF